MTGNYPAGVTDNDQHFDMPSAEQNVEKPYTRWRHPPGCPDSDWCRGNGVCYWDCQADPDLWIAAADQGLES